MNLNVKRWKTWDWAVMVAFVLMIIGLSLAWWSVDSGGLGFDASVNGWNSGLLVFGWILCLVALVVVVVKALLPVNQPLPSWYMEGLAVAVVGVLCTLFSVIRVADNPGGGILDSGISRGAGGFITLIASLVVLVAGVMMFLDKSGAYGKSTLPKITTNAGAPMPPAGYQPPTGYQPPAPPAANPAAGAFCSNCGGPLAPGDAACKNCGKPV